MKYVVLIHSNPQPWGHPTSEFVAEFQALPAEQKAQMEREFDALLTELHEAGELVGGEALADPASVPAVPLERRPAAADRRSLLREQGAPRRLLPDRRRVAGPGRGGRRAVLGSRRDGRAATGDVARWRRPVTAMTGDAAA